MTVFRSHRAILGLSASTRAAPMVSYWPAIHRISMAMSGRRTISSLRNVRDAFNDDVGGVGLTRKIQQQKYNIYTLQRPPQSRWNSSFTRRRGRFPKLSDNKTLEEAIEATYEHLDTVSPRDMAAFWTIVSKILQKQGNGLSNKHDRDQGGRKMHHQFDTILAHTLKEIEAFEYRDLAQTTLGFAKIVKNIGNHRRRMPPKGSHHQILRTFLIGENSGNKEFILSHIAAASMPILPEFDNRSLSNFIYAYGLTEYILQFEDGSNFFDVLALEVRPRLDGFDSRDFSNVLWAYANVGASNAHLFKEAGDIIVMHDLGKFSPQALSNILWAYAALGESHPMLFKEMADHIIKLDNLGMFWPQALSNTVWAYATLDESHPELFKKIAAHIVKLENLGAFRPQDLSNIAWAYATLGESHPMLFKGMADHISELANLRDFTPQALSNIVWAYATANESQPKLFEKVADAAIAKQDDFNSQNMANLLWSYTTNGQTDQRLFKSLAQRTKTLLGRFNSQQNSNIAWAYAVANVTAPSLFNDDFINACQEKIDEFTLEELLQLHQWHLWQEELKSNIRLSPSLREKCYDAFVSTATRSSGLQDDVTLELISIGLQPKEEFLTERGYRLDALVEVDGNKIGIEVDGPSHFLGRKPTGSTILKRRQVTNLEGISVVSVPYWQWNKLGKDRRKKQQYLRDLLGLN